MARSRLSDLITRLTLLEEQIQRHEDEISVCLGRLSQGLPSAEVASPQISSIADSISRLERAFQGEQRYRQAQGFLYGERHVEKFVTLGFSLLKK
jgi:hypothetical protein